MAISTMLTAPSTIFCDPKGATMVVVVALAWHSYFLCIKLSSQFLASKLHTSIWKAFLELLFLSSLTSVYTDLSVISFRMPFISNSYHKGNMLLLISEQQIGLCIVQIFIIIYFKSRLIGTVTRHTIVAYITGFRVLIIKLLAFTYQITGRSRNFSFLNKMEWPGKSVFFKFVPNTFPKAINSRAIWINQYKPGQ